MKSTHAIRRFAVAFGFILLFSGVEKGALGQPTDKVVLLDQGWSLEERLQYYFTSQGSAVMSCDLFLNLEQGNSEELFRSNKNYALFGFLVQEPDPKYNPARTRELTAQILVASLPV
jgi:hypothetical protein